MKWTQKLSQGAAGDLQADGSLADENRDEQATTQGKNLQSGESSK